MRWSACAWASRASSAACWEFGPAAYLPSARRPKARRPLPGRLLAGELRDIYRIEMVDQATQVYGVAGDPVSHSLSPVMMNAAFRRETVNAVYLALHAKSLKDLLACVQDIPIRGLSITMPYKQDIVDAAGEFRSADPADRRLQHRGPRRRWQALRLQYRRGWNHRSAGAADAAGGSAGSDRRRRWRRPGGGFRPEEPREPKSSSPTALRKRVRRWPARRR